MLSALGAILGFGSSLIPSLLKFWQDKKDKEHELAVMKMQMEMQAAGAQQRLAEIDAQADIEESKALYESAKTQPIQLTGNTLMDGFASVLNNLINFYNGSVRPTVTYSFFGLYAWVKYASLGKSADVTKMWTEEDMAIFVTIVTFWFGHRMMSKMTKKAA